MSLDITQFWTAPPPAPSPRLSGWLERLRHGWRPNRRIRSMGYEEAAEFFGVYIWKYFNVLSPLLRKGGAP